jgi:hypothetical protein
VIFLELSGNVEKVPDGILVLRIVLLTDELSQFVEDGALVACTCCEDGASVIILLGGHRSDDSAFDACTQPLDGLWVLVC